MDGADQDFEADLVVHGAGRVPEIDDMHLDTAGIEWDPRRGVKVNEYLQSVSNPAVYAAGDGASSAGPPLTPAATYEGKIVVENLLNGNHRKPNYEGIPSVVFTLPPLASVGLQEQSARERGLAFRTNHEDTSSWYSSRRVGEQYSGFKTLFDPQTGRILGAHLLGPDAGETINIFAVAIRKGLTSADLKDILCLSYTRLGCLIHGLRDIAAPDVRALNGRSVRETRSSSSLDPGDRPLGGTLGNWVFRYCKRGSHLTS
jgi:glutathione reductase (NADPH)